MKIPIPKKSNPSKDNKIKTITLPLSPLPETCSQIKTVNLKTCKGNINLNSILIKYITRQASTSKKNRELKGV